MSGLNTNTKDLGQSFHKFQDASKAAWERKNKMILEFKAVFIQKGFSEFMAANLAEEKYRLIHKMK